MFIKYREIINQYNRLLKDVETKDFYKVDLTNRVNIYRCNICNHITKTIDIDAGVTAATINCENCKKTAWSSFYRVNIPDQEPTQEWYRPTLKELLRLRKDKNNAARYYEIEYVLKGGLLLRHITSKNDQQC